MSNHESKPDLVVILVLIKVFSTLNQISSQLFCSLKVVVKHSYAAVAIGISRVAYIVGLTLGLCAERHRPFFLNPVLSSTNFITT